MNQNTSLEGCNPMFVAAAIVSHALVSKAGGNSIDSVARNSCRKSLAVVYRFVLLCTLGVMALSPLHLHAQSGTPAVLNQLTEFTETLKSFSADFTQVVYDADSNPVQQSAGDVVLMLMVKVSGFTISSWSKLR